MQASKLPNSSQTPKHFAFLTGKDDNIIERECGHISGQLDWHVVPRGKLPVHRKV